MALGASASTVLRQIIRENMRTVVGGAAAGWAIVAYFYTRFMRGTLDVDVFATVPLLLLAVAVIACWVPARRASQIDPVVALRAD
jgi:ABC-type antimicrobial peptide transport system permease subunit